MDRFISFAKNVDFIGRAAAEEERSKGAARTLVPFAVDALDADVHGYEPVWIDGKVQGFCTSGGYSHHAEASIAMALIPKDAATEGLEVEIEILGEMRPAKLLTEALFDPDGARLRG